MQILII